ncbi:hypothetical protein [Caldibacillus debilis]|uniref:hypothetical protein n=1 Tax=Caldibacillus debilis TaxID=301148 RepID=UPI0012905486|nr:hypothetical protein [Caldibacillus debilis]
MEKFRQKMESSGAIEKCFDIRFQTVGRHLGAVIFLSRKEAEKNGTVRKKGNRRFFVGVFRFQHRRPMPGGFEFASRFRLRLSAHGHIGRFSVAFMLATLALAARKIFRKQRFFEKVVPVRHLFGEARIQLMHVRGQFCDAIVREG